MKDNHRSTSPFQRYTEIYEKWFVENKLAYKAELKAVKSMLPAAGKGIEIGVGTARFAAPLGIEIGIEPIYNMGIIAKQRGIQVIAGVAEQLPVQDTTFDFVLMVTTICFLDDIHRFLQEAYRVLRINGCLVVAFIDRDSFLGEKYSARKQESLFYKDAVFYSANELIDTMKVSGFTDFQYRQTLFHELGEITINEPCLPGYGKGSFVVMRGEKTASKKVCGAANE